MRTLHEKIRANAAEKLVLPPGRQPAQELPRYKNFLKVESHRLKLRHRAGASGREVCHARAEVLDNLLRHLWDAAKESFSAQAKKEFPPLALVAIGGYGRGELNPHSDIDFMFLHSGQVVAGSKPLPYLARIIDGILYPLWDLGLKVGHSTRSIDDCVKVANEDMQSKTSLIESRLICGEQTLFEKFQKAVVAKCVEGHVEEYIDARVADQTARRTKSGNSATMQEPNIKNGCGGLRDFQNLLWMAFFKYRTRSLIELEKQGLIKRAERKQLEEAYDFLLRVRTDLHYHADRAVDVLTKSVQPAIAHNLGHTERSPSKRIEKFMREVYSHSRNIYLITRTLEQRLALLPRPKSLLSLGFLTEVRRKKQEQTVEGFKISDGEISAATPKVFRDDPRRLMRVFLYAQQRNLRLHPDLAQLIRNELALVDRKFLHDPHVAETFLEILNQRGNVAPILRAMHETDLLGKYIPDFGKMTCLVQHEFYHQYTADEHTLVCLEQLDRVWEASKPPHSNFSELFRDLERPFVLYLALLLHDVGKVDGHGNHSEVGSKVAARVAKRLKLDDATTQTLQLVIEHHLLMARLSERRDLEDPGVIRSFARVVKTPETLALLTIHTFVDTLATSSKLWNGFKETLLWELHLKTMPLLVGGTEFVREESKHREMLLVEVEKLKPEDLTDEEIAAHFATLSPRYFQIHSAKEILDDLVLTHLFMRLQIADEAAVLAPVVNWHNEPDRGYNAVTICSWDRAGMFSKIAGSFSACGLNILSAQIFTRTDGIVLDTFFVNDAQTGTLASTNQRDQFEKLLVEVLTTDTDHLATLIEKQKSARPIYQSYEGDRMATVISFDNETSDTRTVIEIETEDRVGLLYAISQTLSELDLNISAAKIITEKGAAIDSFYVNELDGGKVLDAERQKLIEQKLRAAVARLS